MSPSFDNLKKVHVEVPLFSVSVLYSANFEALVDCNHGIRTNHFWPWFLLIWVESPDFVVEFKMFSLKDGLLTSTLRPFSKALLPFFLIKEKYITHGNVCRFY